MKEIVKRIARHVILPPGARTVAAFWPLHTYISKAFRYSPRLAVSSSDPDSGKTTLLDLISLLVFRALPAASISGPAFYRTVERYGVALMADEADSWLRENEELRGCFNAGHRQGGQVIKCVGED